MREVNLYIEMDKTAFQKIERKCGYVLEYITPTGETKTREGYRKTRSTYNQEFLGALAEALGRIHEPCTVIIHGQNRFALNMLQNRLKEWAIDNFISNGKPVMNKEEWEAVWREVQKHEITVEIGKHAYSGWILREMEEQCEKNR